jgi:hypothetical protein
VIRQVIRNRRVLLGRVIGSLIGWRRRDSVPSPAERIGREHRSDFEFLACQ